MTASRVDERVRQRAERTRLAIVGRWRRIPLRTRLTALATLAVAVAVLAVSSAVFLVAAPHVRAQFDRKLLDQANSLAAVLDGAARGDRRPLPGQQKSSWDEGDTPLFQMVDRDGLIRRPEAQTERLPINHRTLAVLAGHSRPVYDDFVAGGRRYRMVTVPSEDGIVQFARQPIELEDNLTKLALLLLTISAAGVAAAALFGWFVAKAGLAPVDRLTAAAEHVAATQDLTAAIPVNGGDELARLGRAFNEMLAALGTSRDAQRRLVEDASHELRTPLTSLRTNIELLIRADETGRAVPAADRARLLHDLNAQMVELAQLITELVELARNDTSEELSDELDLADVVMAAVERARVRTPGVRIDASLASAPVVGRAATLERAVLNMLDNATKWTPPGEPISVRLGRTSVDGRDCAVLEVEDRGPGVAEEDRGRIFERFYRATSARAMPGSGLGLAIVHQAVTAHGGSVSVATGAAGGALFRVVLPSSDVDELQTAGPLRAETLPAQAPPTGQPSPWAAPATHPGAPPSPAAPAGRDD